MGLAAPSAVSPRPRAGQAGFLLATVASFGLDALMTVPPAAERDGLAWTAFGTWGTTVPQFLLVMALLYLPLLLRRRWPVAIVAVMSVVALVLAGATDYSQPLTAPLITLYTAASRVSSPLQARVALGMAALALTAQQALTAPPDNPVVLGMAVVLGLAFTVWFVGRREHQASVRAASLPGQLAEHRELAAAQERDRIARELHDILAHSVSAMMMQAAGARAVTTAVRQDGVTDPRLDAVERALATIEGTGSQSMRELHRLLSVLRGAEGEDGAGDSSSQPGLAQIAPLVDITRQSGLVVEVHPAGPAVRVDPSVGLAAYRVVQESLANAMKHGGRGAVVDIFENWQPHGLQLQVRCRSGHEGTLRGTLGGGSGLVGLRERVELIGGTFESGWAGEEFVTTAMLPLTPPVGDDAPQRRRR